MDVDAGMRRQIPMPQGELLPAEERLANVLKAIDDRLIAECRSAQMMEYHGEDMTPEYDSLRTFISGLDIAWSLAQTEALRRTDSP